MGYWHLRSEVVPSISGVQVEVGHDPFYAFACRSEVKALDVDGASAESTTVSTRDRARRPQSGMYLEVGGILQHSESVGAARLHRVIDSLCSLIFSVKRSELLRGYTSGRCGSWCNGCSLEQSWVEWSQHGSSSFSDYVLGFLEWVALHFPFISRVELGVHRRAALPLWLALGQSHRQRTTFNLNNINYSLDLVLFVGAKKAREVVFNVLWDACVHDDLSITEALAIVKAIFAENAKQFYKLDASSRYSDVEPLSLSSPFKKEELNGPLTDVTAVRVIWLDFSAQHRCRAAEEETWSF
ncbi:hypothetical protein H5410_003350 [Solanum commersonii]|uniref:Uncharacterized protein n=1 Tax=Solanum commersonii TaxID=4109 RepID=A0A9J6B4K9_SOLCO|nr:hypothetical protein H5410_003350 [Solanum commersonii]